MRKALLKPNGPSRVLHAAAARANRHRIIAHRKGDYRRAYEYLDPQRALELGKEAAFLKGAASDQEQ